MVNIRNRSSSGRTASEQQKPDSMTPPFLFRITEMRQRTDVPDIRDRYGQWCPPRRKGYNRRRVSMNSDDRVFRCNGQSISSGFLVDQENELSQHYKTISIYVDHDVFHIVNYDATQLQVGDGRHTTEDSDSSSGESDDTTVPRIEAFYMDWSRLRFEHGDANANYASYATYAGPQTRLRTQRQDQTWVRRLLPEAYHAAQASWTRHGQYGGMNGELPIILALIAYTADRAHLTDVLRAALVQGCWNLNAIPQISPGQFAHGRTDRRGFVISVYAYPQYSDAEALERYERGGYGMIFP